MNQDKPQDRPKLQIRREIRPQSEMVKDLEAAEQIIESARVMSGADSKPWNLVSPREKRQRNFGLPATLAEKLEYVYRRHPNQYSKSDLVCLSLEPFLDKLIAEIDQDGK